MIEFDFKRPTRRCSRTEQEIRPGEFFYSALIEGPNGELIRSDFSEQAWEGPPADCIGWWRSRIPSLDQGRVYWVPRSVLLAFFDHVYQQSPRDSLTYVTALLLVRKKILIWHETLERDGRQVLVIQNPKTKTNYEVESVDLTPPEVEAIQQNLASKLFTDQQVAEDAEVDEEGVDHAPS